MKIILDDTRAFPKGDFNCVRTYESCILLLSVFRDKLEFISLDFHLGSGAKHTGLDVLIYMHQNGVQPKQINIHSCHERGVPLMSAYAEKNFPNAMVTANKLEY